MTTPQNNGWHGDFQRLDEKLSGMAVQIERIAASMVSRVEIEAELNRRVAAETYQADMRGVQDRVNRLESGPQRLLGWIALIISGGVGCLSLLIGVAAIVTTIIIATHH